MNVRYVIKHILYFLIAVLLSFNISTVVCAQPIKKLAILPVQDLSKGFNGVDLRCTGLLQQDLKDVGIKVIPTNKVIAFLVRHRIRWIGFLTRFEIMSIRKELGADYLLIPTICEDNNKTVPRVGMSMILIDTENAYDVWAWVGALSKKDFIHPLGLFEPQGTKELMERLVVEAANAIPKDINSPDVTGQEYSIKSIVLRPKCVKPGQAITCSLRFCALRSFPNMHIKLLLGAHKTFDLIQGANNVYRVVFVSPNKPGTYPVHLLITGVPSGSRRFFLGILRVDNSPPRLKLVLSSRVHVWNAVAVMGRITIVPRLISPEPISRWHICVATLDGDELISQDGPGPLPAHFFWRGQNASGANVATGVYKVVLTVWDRAGNSATATAKVAVIRTPPKIILKSKVSNGILHITLKNSTDIPLAFWRLEVLTKSGGLVRSILGDTLPATLKIDIKSLKGSPVDCFIRARDIFGNMAKEEFLNLAVSTNKKRSKKVKAKKKSSWTSQF